MPTERHSVMESSQGRRALLLRATSVLPLCCLSFLPNWDSSLSLQSLNLVYHYFCRVKAQCAITSPSVVMDQNYNQVVGIHKRKHQGKKVHQITKITLHRGHNAQHEACVWSWVLCATLKAWPCLLEAQLLLFYFLSYHSHCFPFHSQSSQLHFCHPHCEGSHPTQQAGQEAVVFIISLKWMFQHSSSRESRYVGGPQKTYNHWEPPLAQPFLLWTCYYYAA